MAKPDILIVKLSAIGDVVHTLPALNTLRQHYPQACITWLVEAAAADLVLGHPALDHVLVSHRQRWFKGLFTAQWPVVVKQIAAFICRLRDRQYDMVFDFQAALKGAFWISMVHGRRKIGFDRGLEHQEHSYLVLNERIPAVSMETHALDRNLMMLEAVGIRPSSIEYNLPITPDHDHWASQQLYVSGIPDRQPFVAINPMATWETKLWDPQKFAEVADRVQTEFGWPVVFTGGPGDRAYIENLMKHMHTSAPNLAGRTDLMTLGALLQRASLMITTDTGPMHIAAAVGTPTVALFGPTAPWRTGPHGKGHRIVRTDSPCSPCFKRRCPDTCACMSSIRVEQVMCAVNDQLSAKRNALPIASPSADRV
ncbi:MAG: glycosyltransferase family 9 protein [Desulfobacteraceae bacterium]|jgi:3-deoxy-D-manno-octulosonic-acid transferase/heptosyltransferase-1|nr:glycosyltransferase family 9 protein [Desulfobacteraceae bacterium]